MSLRLVTPAATTIISLVEAKAQCRVLHEDEDTYIADLIDAAQDWIAGEKSWLGRGVVEQEWELTLSAFPDGRVDLPRPPLVSVDGVFYTPSGGGAEVEITTFRTINAAMADGGYILPAKNTEWPETDNEPGSVRVAFTTGFATVPPAIKHAMLLMVGHWYKNREAASEANMSDLPFAVDALLYPYRNWA